jgi:hypothetical protein
MHKPKTPEFRTIGPEPDLQTLQKGIGDANEAAKRAGCLMIKHPTTGDVVTAQVFDTEMGQRHEAMRPPSQFWAPLPVEAPTE